MEHCRNYEQSQGYVEPAGHPEVKYLNICSNPEVKYLNICSNPEVNYLFKFLFTKNYLMFSHGIKWFCIQNSFKRHNASS